MTIVEHGGFPRMDNEVWQTYRNWPDNKHSARWEAVDRLYNDCLLQEFDREPLQGLIDAVDSAILNSRNELVIAKKDDGEHSWRKLGIPDVPPMPKYPLADRILSPKPATPPQSSASSTSTKADDTPWWEPLADMEIRSDSSNGWGSASSWQDTADRSLSQRIGARHNRQRCWKCGQRGHIKNNCPRNRRVMDHQTFNRNFEECRDAMKFACNHTIKWLEAHIRDANQSQEPPLANAFLRIRRLLEQERRPLMDGMASYARMYQRQ